MEEVRAHYRKKSSVRQKDLPDDLLVEEIEHVLPAEERGCPHCDQEQSRRTKHKTVCYRS